jgi:hypothetical protein
MTGAASCTALPNALSRVTGSLYSSQALSALHSLCTNTMSGHSVIATLVGRHLQVWLHGASCISYSQVQVQKLSTCLLRLSDT